jgi:hypothetical protein
MRTLDLVGLVVLASFVAACGNSSTPTAPTVTPPAVAITWTLTGTVTSSALGAISAATVAIVDGPDAGKAAATDIAGRYSFSGLQQAGFTLRASANGYTPVSKGVTLTSNTATDFQLPRLPLAALTFEGLIGFDARPDGDYDLHGTGVNSGDGCASSISGTTTLSAVISLTLPWKLPASLTVRPGERFQYNFGPMSRADFIALSGANGTYITRFLFITTPCS